MQIVCNYKHHHRRESVRDILLRFIIRYRQKHKTEENSSWNVQNIYMLINSDGEEYLCLCRILIYLQESERGIWKEEMILN